MKKVVKIGGREILPGERITMDIPLANLYTHTQLSMPIQVIRSKKDGPSLFICAAIHGDEINGVEIIRRLVRMSAMKRIRGMLIAVPVVNVYGFLSRRRYLPDRRDLNRSFPGSSSGSLTSRLAHLFMEEVVNHCSLGIDLHSGSNNRTNLPQIRASMDHPPSAELAMAFGTPIVLNANVRDGSLRQTVLEMGLPMLVYEGGESLRFDEIAIRAGVRGIMNIMRKIRMLPPLKRPRKNITPLIARRSAWVRATQGGILRSQVTLGARVKKGEPLGFVGDPFGEKMEEVFAPFSGLVVGRTNLPLVNEGEALYHVADFQKHRTVAAAVENFQTDLDPDVGLGPSGEPPIL